MTARHRWVYWVTVIALGTATVGLVHGRTSSATAAKTAWGQTQTVWVAEVDLVPGDRLGGKARSVSYPRAIVPDAAIGSPVGTVRQHVDAGSILTESDLDSDEDALALAPPGWVGVAVVESVGSGAQVGDRVAVAAEGIVLAEDALVIGHDADTVLVALDPSVAAIVAAANDSGHVALILTR